MSERLPAPRSAAPLLIATRNAGKLEELRALFAAVGREVIDLDRARVPRADAEETLEVHATFKRNALTKARYYHAASNGLPTVADDSGLEVHALGGAPGVHSRRWSGADGDADVVTAANNAKLIAQLEGHADRSAHFTCVVAYVDSARELTCRGTVAGRIATAPRGAHGFGYDPLFEADELGGRTFAEATLFEKQSISHRARAFAGLAPELAALLGSADGSMR